MRTTTISKGGQLSIPAVVRHRWSTRRVVIEDRGSAIVVRPVPDDPIGAAMGSLRGRRTSSDRARAIVRDEEAAIDDARRVGR
jgi:bifunctional DNA-binding transcriptional regulator/antitoxin component of YhaV-PrlF toxin-antitoxin module